MLLFILIIFLIDNNVAFQARIDRKLYRFDKFLEPCQNDTALMDYNISLKNFGKSLIFDYDSYLHQTIEKANVQFQLIFERCSSRETLDSCKIIRTLNTNKGCFIIGAKDQLWSPIYKCSNPKLNCPLQKGQYKGTNCTLDFSALNYIPLGRQYWKMKARAYLASGITIMCMIIDVQVIRN